MSFIGPYTDFFLNEIKKEFKKSSTQKKIMSSTVEPLINNIIRKNRFLLSIIVFIVVFLLSLLLYNTYQLTYIKNTINSRL